MTLRSDRASLFSQIAVADVLAFLADGMPVTDILEKVSGLTVAKVRTALLCAAERLSGDVANHDPKWLILFENKKSS
ncbi:DUF433 domain-containing protein [Hahella sp. HN01]|uniref:DUF433 domain-containing protein n=1 Tax=Hahella sp. HN01 TaxID=2847262 RepID=UPI001C1F1D94|nr:DUF433 domain-containing protein [Hahella sp. HN01]